MKSRLRKMLLNRVLWDVAMVMLGFVLFAAADAYRDHRDFITRDMQIRASIDANMLQMKLSILRAHEQLKDEINKNPE